MVLQVVLKNDKNLDPLLCILSINDFNKIVDSKRNLVYVDLKNDEVVTADRIFILKHITILDKNSTFGIVTVDKIDII